MRDDTLLNSDDDETVTASQDDQVDIMVKSNERKDLYPGLNGLDVCARKCSLGKALRHDF